MKAVRDAVYMSIFGTTQFTHQQTTNQTDTTENTSNSINTVDTEIYLEATGT